MDLILIVGILALSLLLALAGARGVLWSVLFLMPHPMPLLSALAASAIADDGTAHEPPPSLQVSSPA